MKWWSQIRWVAISSRGHSRITAIRSLCVQVYTISPSMRYGTRLPFVRWASDGCQDAIDGLGTLFGVLHARHLCTRAGRSQEGGYGADRGALQHGTDGAVLRLSHDHHHRGRRNAPLRSIQFPSVYEYGGCPARRNSAHKDQIGEKVPTSVWPPTPTLPVLIQPAVNQMVLQIPV